MIEESCSMHLLQVLCDIIKHRLHAWCSYWYRENLSTPPSLPMFNGIWHENVLLKGLDHLEIENLWRRLVDIWLSFNGLNIVRSVPIYSFLTELHCKQFIPHVASATCSGRRAEAPGWCPSSSAGPGSTTRRWVRGLPGALLNHWPVLSNNLWQFLKSSDIWTKKLMAVAHFPSHDHVRVTPSFCSFLGPFYGPYLSRAKRSVCPRV